MTMVSDLENSEELARAATEADAVLTELFAGDMLVDDAVQGMHSSWRQSLIDEMSAAPAAVTADDVVRKAEQFCLNSRN